jgi:peptidoglycan/LPS O-acetylase OafA/YrhL
VAGATQVLAAGSPAGPERSSSALGQYVEALDGIRCVGIGAVLWYHAGMGGLEGAFLSISLFFTLSGYLITSMLLRANATRGGIDVRSFWSRRYRRLLPGAYLTLAGVVLFGATVATEQQLEHLPGSVVACFAQVANWFFVVSDQSYIAMFSAPSPVHHYWSLALEEQFYLLFPLAMVFLLRRTRSMRVVAGVLLAGAVASALTGIVLFERGASIDRIYLGTDTRASEILVGALLAVVLHRRPLSATGPVARFVPWIGLACGLGTLWGWRMASMTDAAYYRGGFFAFSFVSAGLVAGAVSGRGPLAAFLSWGFLPAIGRASYSMYLVHWPLFLWLDEERTGLSQNPLFALRVAVTLVVAGLSYNFVEMPLRNRSPRPTRVPWLTLPRLATAAVGVVVLGAVLVSQRDVDTDLAGLGTDPIEPPPSVVDDGIVDVLVIADTDGATLASAIEAAAPEPADVVAAEPFTCATPTCDEWLDGWGGLVEAHDPDVILLQVDDWSAAEIAEASGVEGLEAQTDWTTSVVAAGLDVLSSRGATVLWSQDAVPTVEASVRRRFEPFHPAMQTLISQRSDLRRRASFGREPADLWTDLLLHQRVDDSGAPRVMVVGDSTAGTMAHGLERWAGRTGRAVVWSAATEGCGVADDGLVRDVAGRTGEVPDVCRDVRARWQAGVEQFDPDVVIVMSELLDIQTRQLEDWPDFLVPGDADFDRYLVDEFQRAHDVLAGGGATVVWFSMPCVENSIGFGNVEPGVFDTERARHVNDVVLPDLRRSAPELRVFDLFGVLCPDGTYAADLDGIEAVRPDGIHFSTEGAEWFAENYGDQLLELASS